ncbi:MAG: substrate-binding domain-containing protein [Kiritimatiellae bacterium]|nr:substrate-binding domain-containing protein [Kiritimatiellia bacterium]
MSRKYPCVCVAILIVLASVVWPAGCRGRRGGEEVLVLCGGSMRALLEEVIACYRTVSDDAVLATYGGSGELCAQLQQTGRGDLYICHDPFMPWAEKQGLIARWATLGYMDVVIVVPKGNPKAIRGLADLARPGLRLGVGSHAYSTSGAITKSMLDKLPYGAAIRDNVRMESRAHQQRCTDVAMGMLDASIVWNVVARRFADKLDIMPIPAHHIDAVTSATYGESDLRNVKVTVGIVRGAKDREAVQRFYAFAVGECQAIMRRHGLRTEAR